jgi:hypothetical protein
LPGISPVIESGTARRGFCLCLKLIKLLCDNQFFNDVKFLVISSAKC